MDSDLARQLQAKDFEALNTARRLGERAMDTLTQALDSKDGEVRELAVMCLNEVPGSVPAPALLRALNDSYVAIPARAAAYLMDHHSPEILPDLLLALDRNRSAVVRARLALVVGAIGDQSAVPQLVRRAEQPGPPEVVRSLRLALARLAAEPALSEFLAELRAEDWRVRFQALRDFEYLHRPDLVGHVAPLLDDKTPVGTIDSPPARDVLRICDFAVLIIAKVVKTPFGFNATGERIFTDAEIAAVKASINNPGR